MMRKTIKNLVLVLLSMLVLASSPVLSSPPQLVQADPPTYQAILRPNDVGDLNNLYVHPSGTHWDKE